MMMNFKIGLRVNVARCSNKLLFSLTDGVVKVCSIKMDKFEHLPFI